jgi:hypothetical protein
MAKQGENYAPWPLDYKLLSMIPEIGTIGGVHWKGRRVKDLTAELNAEGIEVNGNLVSARMRSMSAAGLVKQFGNRGAGRIWAKTPAGVEHQATEEITTEEASNG